MSYLAAAHFLTHGRPSLDEPLDTGSERQCARDTGLLTPAHRSAFGKRIAREIGSHSTHGGRTIQFGKREQSRKAVFTLRLLS